MLYAILEFIIYIKKGVGIILNIKSL